MTEDYLWDKTGSDAELERLEGLLSEFRYSEAIQAESNILEFPSKAKSVLKPWIFALAACVAVGAVTIGVWNLGTTDREEKAVQMVQVAEIPTNMPKPMAPAAMVSDIKNLPRPVAAVRSVRTPPQRKYTAAIRKRERSSEMPALTKEERYAYGQLMLALNITSSKLQVVKDSINGIDEEKADDR